jgi:hypothetical protein
MHPVSADYHVLPSDWTATATWSYRGEDFAAELAQTPAGFFAKCSALWSEAKGETADEAIANLANASRYLLDRQWLVADVLRMPTRFTGRFGDLKPLELLMLLYCRDRDIANDAKLQIETHASLRIFGPSLIAILKDVSHPHRRIAQWCALDLFEDLPSFCSHGSERSYAIEVIRRLLHDAPDDYARTTFKAGVVLGGHVADDEAADALLATLNAPSKIGRRAAIHGLFHLCEWLPKRREEVIGRLHEVAQADPEPLLRTYAEHLARDIQRGDVDHVVEPVFPDEP